MTRKECLDKTAECVLQDRASQYGGPENNFGRIAKLWSVYTGTVLDGIDVAMMMALLKVARIRNNKDYSDGYIDLAGYAACGAELAGAEKAREDATRRWGEEYKRLRAEAEGDAKAEDCEEPEFQRDDKVEAQMTPDSSTWTPATIMAVYRDKDTCEWRYCVDFEDGWARLIVPPARVRSVSAPKAEGCEDLVFDEARMRESMPGIVPQDGPSDFDAPQTAQELYKRIIANNPATYGTPHKPTGEELAEMAEEEEKHE